MSHFTDPDNPGKSFSTFVRNGNLTIFHEIKGTTHSIDTPAVNVGDIETETITIITTRKIVQIQTP